MKILFSADEHLLLRRKKVPVDWEINRFQLYMEKMWEMSKEVDLVIHGGDFFDKVPNLRELSLFFTYVGGLTTPTIMFDGNHEATRKGQTFLSYLKKAAYNLNPLFIIMDSSMTYINPETNKPEFDIIPYCQLKTPDEWKQGSKSILFTHVRGEIPPHVKPEIDLDLLNRWHIVFAGDLHSHTNCQRNIVYPGSPMTTSFHRKLTTGTNGVIKIETSAPQDYEWIDLNLPQLIRKKVSVGEPREKDSYHHIVYEVEGTQEELRNLEEDELLDKKLVMEEEESPLLLKGVDTIEEEVALYLTEVEGCTEQQVKKIIGWIHDYIEKVAVG